MKNHSYSFQKIDDWEKAYCPPMFECPSHGEHWLRVSPRKQETVALENGGSRKQKGIEVT